MKKTLLIIVLFISLNAGAQNIMSTYNMRHLPQVVYANPAFIPLARVNISAPYLGSIYTQFGKSKFETNVFSTDENGTTLFDAKKFIDGLEQDNSVYTNFAIEAINIGFTVGNNYFFLTSNDKIKGQFNFPKEMALVITEVQDEYGFNKPVDMSDIAVHYTHYREYGLGWSRKLNQKITIGANFKFLSGIVTAQSGISGRFTPGADTNDIDGLVDVRILTSGVENYQEDLKRINSISDFLNSPFVGFTGLNNNGFAFDLGIDYRINQKIKIAFSAIDILAQIEWAENVSNYEVANVDVSFNSIDGKDLIDPTTYDNSLRNFLDSIAQTTDPSEAERNFVSQIPTKIMGSFTYYITPKIEATLLGQAELADNYFQPYLRIGIQGRFKRFLNYSVSYSIIDPRATVKNLGLGLALNLGPVQLYALTDNVFDPFLFQSSFNPSLRFGLNFTFGRDHE